MSRFPLVLGSLATVALLTACGGGTPVPSSSAAPTAVESLVPSPEESGTGATTEPEPTGAETPGSATELEGATLTPDGLGPILVGMSLPEAQAHGWVARSTVCDRWDANADLLDEGVSLRFVDDRLYEITVFKPGFATEAGVQVGATGADLREAYGSDLRVETRRGAGGDYPARFVRDGDGDNELLFLAVNPPADEGVKSILARGAGTPVVEGC